MKSLYIKRIKLEFIDDVSEIDFQKIANNEKTIIESKYENHKATIDIKNIIVDNGYLILPFYVNEKREFNIY